LFSLSFLSPFSCPYTVSFNFSPGLGKVSAFPFTPAFLFASRRSSSRRAFSTPG
jgi:hypothetical protein